MRNHFLPCAAMRLFIPEILVNHKTLIYMDTDMIVFENLRELWKEFGAFSRKTLIGGVPVLGQGRRINSGLMLMNLTRMRRIQWTQKNVRIGLDNLHITRVYDQVKFY